MFRITALIAMLAAAAAAENLMPLPAKIVPGAGALLIQDTFKVDGGAGLEAAAARLTAYLTRATGIPIRPSVTALTVECGADPVSEAYILDVTPAGARLRSPGRMGVLRGMSTFAQLVEAGREGFAVRSVHIEDQPRFGYRGLLLDSSRHFMPLEVVKRILDGMEFVKLNVFHWHLADDQGFRVESRRFPKLHQMGSDGLYYTQDQVRDVIAYARERGIRVIPEFDIPGHSTSWLVGYPELGSAPGPFEIARHWGVIDNCLDPTREEVYAFLDAFLGEMAALFPDPYFHIGGDEVNGKQWKANARIQKFMRARKMATQHDLQAYFNQRILQILRKHGKKMLGWDEILHPSLPRDIIVHSWRGQKSLAEAATQGYQGILSWGYYIDLMQHAAEHYGVDPLARETANLTPEQQALVLGGEACMWAEYITAENVENRVWPRAAAVAERLWSPAAVTDVNSMYQRLEAVSRKLGWVGARHRLNMEQMLDRLAGAHGAALRVLASAVEPVKGYARSRARKYTQSTPLNRMVDTVPAESERAREFLLLVDEFLARRAGPETLRAPLIEWRDNDALLQPLLKESELVAELAPLSKDLSALATAALEAVEAIASGRRTGAAWADRQKSLLDNAAKPRAELIVGILDPVRKLVSAAGL